MAGRTSSSWWTHGGVNCYAGHGATEIDHASAGRMSLDSCKSLCDKTPNCVGVTYSNLQLNWTAHLNLNCYSGHGAKDMTLPYAPNTDTCYDMTLNECQTQCFLTGGSCTAVAWEASTGTCCARSEVRVSKCDNGGGTWSTYVLSPPVSTATGDCWRRSAIEIALCDTQGEAFSTHVRHALPAEPWWLTTNAGVR